MEILIWFLGGIVVGYSLGSENECRRWERHAERRLPRRINSRRYWIRMEKDDGKEDAPDR